MPDVEGPEAALVAVLAASSDVTALVESRIWPRQLPKVGQVPDRSMPAITYLLVSSPREYSHSGAAGLVNPRIQVDCWADDYDSAKAVGDAVVSAVSGWKGVAGGRRVDVIFVDGDRDDVSPERQLQRRILDLRMWCSEPTPNH